MGLKPHIPLTPLTPRQPVRIDAGLRMPPARRLPRHGKFPWHGMIVGDSFLLPFPPDCPSQHRRRIQQAAAAMVRGTNKREAERGGTRRWEQRTVVDAECGYGVRIFRTK
jgi:hypothetical protein